MVDRNAPRLARRGQDGAARAVTRTAIAALAVAPSVVRLGWGEGALGASAAQLVTLALLALYVATLLWPLTKREGRLTAAAGAMVRENRSDSVVLAAGAALAWWPPALAIAAGALLLLALLGLYLRIAETNFPPGLVFVGSFLVLIIVGTAALKMPRATPPDQPISMLDAAFTATSAVSQTGLVVRPTGEGFTRLGQTVIMVLIQLGAMGVLVFGAVLATIVGSSFGLRATQTLAEGAEQGWTGQLTLKRLVIFTIITTHAIEAVGFAFFYFGWPATWEGAPDIAALNDRLYHSLFFSVSAFCNAGFVTTANSAEGLRVHWTSHLVLAPLIVLGSIGFPVLQNLYSTALARLRGVRSRAGALVRLNLNTKVILTSTLLVYFVGALLVFVGELTQAHQSAGKALLDAHFMTINRTSGFNTIAPGEMGLLGQLSLMFLMFVGGSPGSVAGGIKLMVFSVLALTVWSTLRGRSSTEAFGRTIPDELVRKSATLIVLALLTVMTVAGVLAATQDAPLEALLFEAVSACGTTGLSMGVTPDLTGVGKIAIMAGMFVGRVGAFALLAALFSVASGRSARYAYPRGDVVIY